MKRTIFILALSLSALLPAPAQQPADSSPRPAKQPQPIKTVDPEMPPEARKKHTNGICVVGLEVDVHGFPQNPHVQTCSDPIFEPNTLKAIAQYRFLPARDAQGMPVAVHIAVEVNFAFLDSHNKTVGRTPTAQFDCHFAPPPGTTDSAPDATGIYTLNAPIDAPQLKKLADHGLAEASISFAPGTACAILLTFDAKGRPSDPLVYHCDYPRMTDPAIQTLMASQFKPAKLNNKAVPVHALVKLSYQGIAVSK